MLICLEKEFAKVVIKAMAERSPGLVIYLDVSFKGESSVEE